MSYLLDTNVCIKLLNNSNQAVVKRLVKEDPQKIYLCTVIELELYYGAYRSQRTESNLIIIQRFLNQFKSLSFDGKSAKIAGLLREQLNKKGTPIGVYDLVLVTHNVTEFSRVHGLKYEDWEVV